MGENWRLAMLLLVAGVGLFVFSELADELFEGTLTPVDLSIQHSIRPYRSTPLDWLAHVLSDAPRPPWVFLVAAPFLAYLLWTKRLRTALWVAVFPLATVAVVEVLKLAFHRDRPITAVVAEIGKSFPSSHATGAVVLYGVLGYVAWRYWARTRWARAIVFAIVALLIVGTGLARVYLEVHYPTDVLAGWAAGTCLLAGGILLLRRQD